MTKGQKQAIRDLANQQRDEGRRLVAHGKKYRNDYIRAAGYSLIQLSIKIRALGRVK